MWSKKSLIIALLVMVLILPLASAVSDVAYLYKKSIRIDQNVITEFNSLGLSVDTIQENKITTTDFSKYKIIFVGDELFSNPSKIPVGQRPTIISNYYHGAVFGLTDNDGISQLANNKPLNVNKNSQIIQVYTDAFYQAGVSLAIPYYYLSDENKAPGFTKTAGTYTGNTGLDIGDVVSYAFKGAQLVNGKTLNNKVCFYGLETIKNGKRSSDYWTPVAKQMFEECVEFTGSQCSSDSECNDNNTHTQDTCLNPGTVNSQCVYQNITCITDSECNDNNQRTVDQCVNANTTESYCMTTEVNCLYNSDCGITGFIEENFCFSDDVYRDFQNSTCINPGTLQSHCDIEVSPRLIEQCSEACSDGQCVNIICYNDNDCSDSNAYTKDTCLNPGTITSQCTYQDIACITNNDCNDNNAYTQDTCKNPNTPQSYCEYNDIECITDIDCDDSSYLTADICLHPGTITSQCTHTPIECVYDADCDDNNSSTADSCLNSICHNDLIECFTNFDCGVNSQSELFCSSSNVVQNSTNYACLNAGTKNSYCTQNTQTNILEQCNDVCSNGQCVDIICSLDSECNDDDARTIDQCANPGTTSSFCRNTEVNCLNDLDCGVTGYIEKNFCFTNDVYKKYQNSTCINPATLDSYCVISVIPIKTQECDDNNGETYDYCAPIQDDGAICEHDFIQCSEDSDCGTTQLANEFCKGNDLWGNYSVPNCSNPGDVISQCSSSNEESFIEVCEFGCAQGACLEGVHDVGFIDFTNSFNKILLEYNNGTDILDEIPVISCNEIIKAKVEAKNFGSFYENVTLNGDAGGIVFSLNNINNMIPGGTNLRTSLSPYINLNLPSGFYNITIETIIPIDDNLSNNQAIRTIEIQCETPECTQNNDCGNVDSYLTCDGLDNVINVTNFPICTDGECGENIINNTIEICEFGCYGGVCISQCNDNSDCPSDEHTEQCLGNELNVTAVGYFCNQGVCEQETNNTIEECEFGCSNDQCNEPECNTDNDCGEDEINNFCVGDDLHSITTAPICTQGSCDETINEQITNCEFGCANGYCNQYNPQCGNGILDSGEQCDDGNLANGDGCSSQCITETCENICEAKPFDFELAIDKSSSMILPFGFLGDIEPWGGFILTGPAKITVAKMSAIKFVQKALYKNPNNFIGVSAFSSKPYNMADLTNNEEMLNKGILSIRVSGNTNYHDAIVQGVDKLVSQGRPGTTKVLIFMSDGKPNGISGPKKALEAADYAKSKNVIIFTIGIDGIIHVNAPLLSDIAKRTGGKYYFASSSVAVEGIYKKLGEETCQEICSV
ncbi:hypothetical protein AUJ62_01650 [Candidatus Pacearchaeota archaeon CG1_02_32_21]|nr:MAG: hypothetical protein AUJ62_01650 [Candidatus Pacearchaeota archaeon CG1_02_32_21]